MKKLIKYNIEILTSLFFVSLQILIFLLFISSINFILIYIFIIDLIVIVSLIDGTKKFKENVKEKKISKNDKNIYFYNQLIIPLVLFLSTEVFLIINRFNIYFSELTLIITVVLFFTSLKYFEAYFEVFEFSEKAHFTINAVKLFIFFILIYSLFEVSSILYISQYIQSAFVLLISFTLILMIMQRNKIYSLKFILYSFLISLFISLISLLENIYLQNVLLTTFSISLVFYFFENILHHKFHNTLTREIIIQYILIILILFLLIKGVVGLSL